MLRQHSCAQWEYGLELGLGPALCQGPEALRPRVWVGSKGSPHPLSDRGKSESWHDGDVAKTVAGAAAQTAQPSTRHLGFQQTEWFLWRQKKEGEEVDWLPGCRAGPAVTDGNLEPCGGSIVHAFSRITVPAPGQELAVISQTSTSGREGDKPESRWGLRVCL